MPLDATPVRMSHSDEARAFAYARHLDVLLVDLNDPDEPYNDALEAALLAVGELLGGLSIHGFEHDLRSHLARVEADILEDAPRHEYNPGMGGNDPSQYRSGRLDDMIDTSRADDALDWLVSAEELMSNAA